MCLILIEDTITRRCVPMDKQINISFATLLKSMLKGQYFRLSVWLGQGFWKMVPWTKWLMALIQRPCLSRVVHHLSWRTNKAIRYERYCYSVMFWWDTFFTKWFYEGSVMFCAIFLFEELVVHHERNLQKILQWRWHHADMLGLSWILLSFRSWLLPLLPSRVLLRL